MNKKKKKKKCNLLNVSFRMFKIKMEKKKDKINDRVIYEKKKLRSTHKMNKENCRCIYLHKIS